MEKGQLEISEVRVKPAWCDHAAGLAVQRCRGARGSRRAWATSSQARGMEGEPAPGLGARFPLFFLFPATPVKWTLGGQSGVNLIIQYNYSVTKKSL